MTSEAPVRPPKVKIRRRPWLWVASVLIIALGALMTGAAVNMVRTTKPVLSAAKPIARGATIAESDLAIVEVNPDPGLRMIPADQKSTIVGQAAAVELLTGTLLAPESVTKKALPGEGNAIVGVALTPPQMPTTQLSAGQAVVVISTPRAGDDSPSAAPTIRIQAEVISVSSVPDTNLTVVNVLVPTNRSESLAGLAATGRVALIVTGA